MEIYGKGLSTRFDSVFGLPFMVHISLVVPNFDIHRRGSKMGSGIELPRETVKTTNARTFRIVFAPRDTGRKNDKVQRIIGKAPRPTRVSGQRTAGILGEMGLGGLRDSAVPSRGRHVRITT